MAIDSKLTGALATPTTRIVKGTEKEILELLNEAAVRIAADPTVPCFNVVMDKFGPLLAIASLASIKIRQQKSPNYKVYFLVDIQRTNLEYVKQIVASGVEVRHLGGIKANFAVTLKDYFCYVKSLEQGFPKELVWSNEPNMIEQMLNIYQRLWDSGIPSEIRIKELENELVMGETKLITDPQEISQEILRLAESAAKEILIAAISEEPILHYRDFMNALAKKAAKSAAGNDPDPLKMRLLVPIRDLTKKVELDQILSGVEYRSIASTGISFAVYDKSRGALIQYGHGTDGESESLVSAVFTSNKETVNGLASIFEALWIESELRSSFEKVGRQANLLQDILSHDIRNHNQVIKLSAELLQEELKGNPSVELIVESLLKAVDGSTTLLERTKRLGKILAEKDIRLYSIDLKRTIRESFNLIQAAYYKKKIDLTEVYPAGRDPWVLADELLEEAFSNIFSNSVRYTQGSQVQIEIGIHEEERATQGSRPKKCWKISIADHGQGISDEMKDKLFDRYLSSAKGTGLGMSIVHALVVQRYGGSIQIKDRVPNNHGQGTLVEILLPSAERT